MSLTIYGHKSAKYRLPHEVRAGVANPRTLEVKILSARESRAWQRKLEAVQQIANEDEQDKAVDAALAEVVIGWENIPGNPAFSPDAIRDQFTLGELSLMVGGIPYVMGLSEVDAKKSA